MTIKSLQASDLLTHQGNQILMVGHIFRYHPAIQELKTRIDAGELGKIQLITSQRLHFGKPRTDVGVVHALAIHELDMFCHLLNQDYPDTISCTTSAIFNPDIEETVSITAKFGKVTCFALESWLMPAYGKHRHIVVVGNEKTAKIDYLKPDELQIFDIKFDENLNPINEGQYTIKLPYVEPLENELRHFIQAIETREPPLSDGQVGLRAVEMIERTLKNRL